MRNFKHYCPHCNVEHEWHINPIYVNTCDKCGKEFTHSEYDKTVKLISYTNVHREIYFLLKDIKNNKYVLTEKEIQNFNDIYEKIDTRWLR